MTDQYSIHPFTQSKNALPAPPPFLPLAPPSHTWGDRVTLYQQLQPLKLYD